MAKRGVFKNGVPYVQFGSGAKTLLVFSGGPGNYLASPMYKEFSFLATHYAVFMLARRSGLPEGYSTADMAQDYAVTIRDEFGGGPVDVIGESYGGLIAQHLAANHPRLIRRLVISMSAYRFSQEGAKLDMQFAELASQGKMRAAFRCLAPMILGSRLKRGVFSFFMGFLGPRMLGNQNPADLLVEAHAELAHDSQSQLHRILAPTLVVAGDRDIFCSPELLRRTAEGIPHAELVVYGGKGHESLGNQFKRDVLAFLLG